MSFSAQDALKQARANIEAARTARDLRKTVIKHYRAAKSTLDKVDDTETDTATLREMISAFQDLDVMLDHLGDQDRAKKCKQRANALRQKIDERTRASRQLTPSPPLADISDSVASTSLPFFRKNVDPVPYICPLPSPDEPLQTTRQLAYCLALLQPSVQEGDLPSDALEWRHSALNSPDTKGHLETLSVQIIQSFAKDTMKDSAVIQEVVQLAPVLDSNHSRFLLKSLIDTINQSEILHLHSVEGLANVIQGAAPGSIDSSDLVVILRCLHKRLGIAHSTHHQHHLLIAVSRVLDAMVDAHIGEVDSINLHEPLTDLLRESESSQDPYLIFQDAYATQALLNVSDDENIWRTGLRQGWLVLKAGAGFARMPDPRKIKDVLQGLEILYEAREGGARIIREALEAIKNGETPTFTVKEGIKFKRAWYRAVRTAESYLDAGKLVEFKDLVVTAPCRHQLMFQWGICQLLGQFAVDTQWDSKTRQDALDFLGALYTDSTIWNRQKEADQVIFDMVTNVVPHNAAAKAILEDMTLQSPTLKPIAHLQSPPWKNTQSGDTAEGTRPNITLLKAAQDKDTRRKKQEIMPDLPVQPGIDDICSALRTYHAPDLVILRVSGQQLDLETCFVNLAIVEASTHREKEKEDLKEQAAAFLRIASSEEDKEQPDVFDRFPSFENVMHADTQSLIPLEELFNARTLRDGKEGIPKRILVQGRAGIGKTTLCKKLVHAHQNGLWKDMFDTVVWIPLRHLRGFKSSTLESLFREKVFIAQNLDQRQAALAKALAIRAEQDKVLFILDGLDEILTDVEGDESRTFRTFLRTLLSQQHVVITSRPSGVDNELLPSIDLELETIGFSQKNVKDFLTKVLEPEAARTVRNFIQQTPLIRGLVNIPVQLDVICFSWDSLPRGGTAITMTELYQLMVRKLWSKDALQLKKTAGGKMLTERQLGKSKPKEIATLMATELQHLGYLAFKGLTNNHQIEFNEDDLLCAFEDLQDETAETSCRLPSQLVDDMKRTSFLHTADADLDSGNGDSQQAWHFLHLTFQEYFAATWIARHFHFKQPTYGMMTTEQLVFFLHQHKYNPQYEIVWSMVAGLLESKPLHDFFEILQGEPRDLIGGRHQQILASCLNEARARLDPVVVADLDMELGDGLRFEMKADRYNSLRKSRLGSHISFPDSCLVETLSTVDSWKVALIQTLKDRSALSALAMQFLMTTLKDEDRFIRAITADALGKEYMLSESAILPLIAALKEDDWSIRSSAASALGRQSELSESAIDSLVAALKDENAVVRSSAASALGKQPLLPEPTLLSIVDAMKDDGGRARNSAASVLNSQSTLPGSVIKSLIATLKDKDEAVRCSAVWALGSQPTLPESAIQSLIVALMDENKDVRSSAASALGKQALLPESAIEPLIAALMDDNGKVRSSAASALEHQSMLPDSAIQSLIVSLEDEAIDVRSSAALALGKQAMLPGVAIQSLVVALVDGRARLRSSAASVLGNQSALPESVIQSLTAAFNDEDKGVVYSAVTALSKQSLPESAIQLLIAALKDDNWRVRTSAGSVLGKQPNLPDLAVQSLVDALKDKDDDVRSSAALALGGQSVLPESAISALIDALKDGDERVGSSAASALSNQSELPESAIYPLIVTLSDCNWGARRSAVSVLGKQSNLPESAFQALIATLKDEMKDVRLCAESVLVKQSTWTAATTQSLVTVLQDKNAAARSLAASILGKQSKLSESAIQSLIVALRDEDKSVRYSAASTIAGQTSLMESVIQPLIAVLEDSDWNVRSPITVLALDHQCRMLELSIQSLKASPKGVDENDQSSAASALERQSTLLGAAIQSFTDVLKDGNKNVRASAAVALGKQSTLPESAVQVLIASLADNEGKVRSSAAVALGNQSTVSRSAIQSLIAALKIKVAARHASEALQHQTQWLCLSLPDLTKEELVCVYENHLFPSSCGGVLSLQVRDDRLWFYTEQGVLNLKLASKGRGDPIASVFRAIQRKAGLL
ncbi:hypothetical protein EMPS_04115 [Entomortierella parvispora]|uniref:NACHT domain-containing protein n=1 Tax=Entomortierella parvispora TaxID=205924 RepID=A0A9P3H8H9_9FUNG|nr:hypothetical protein EMPS_04115 [Entomortierella parvispora]